MKSFCLKGFFSSTLAQKERVLLNMRSLTKVSKVVLKAEAQNGFEKGMI